MGIKRENNYSDSWQPLATVVFFTIFLMGSIALNGQVFKTSNIKLYDFFNTFFIKEIPIEVSGLPNHMTENFGLEIVSFTIQHKRVSDLKIQLQSPDGTTVWVSNRNGGTTGENYINTQCRQYGKNGLINNAAAPFTGSFTPSGEFSFFTNNSNPNGTWKLLVEDLQKGEEGFLDSVVLHFGNHPAFIKQRKYCSFSDPNLCTAADKNGLLLPDLVIVPSFTKNQYQEFAYNDPMYPRQLKIAVAIANIGLGPLEVAPDSVLAGNCCNGDSIKNMDAKRFDLYQKIYSLHKNKITFGVKKTGTIYYEKMPGHHHFHVDDWIEMRLVKVVNGKRKLICKGNKVSYCLFTTGMLYEKDSSSIINKIQYGTNMSNYALGEYYACSLSKQGISVGGYDYYGMMYEGQYLQLPQGFKNGSYFLEIEIDPDKKYTESNKSNNTFRMPVTISKQQQ
ncbi:MAG: proprotein convertase P-domain-containing protein [Deinococcales bacterium]|nr:proprotein convertase P-domain-containing protein [Chitinophagaceae bacterium]